MKVGYSRALLRGTENGTYRRVETFGVWFGNGHVSGWRASAMYQRFVDAGEIHRFNGEASIDPDPKTRKGAPGTWSWKRVTVFQGFNRHHVLLSDLKEFVKVRGSVLPSWFESISNREAGKKERAAQAAKARPKHKEGAN